MISLFNIVDKTPEPSDDAMALACVQEIMRLKYNKQKGDPQGS